VGIVGIPYVHYSTGSNVAQPNTPFTAATTVAVSVRSDERLIIRIENVAGALVYIKVGKPVSSTDADYYLESGNAVQITPGHDTVVNFLTDTGTPKIFYRIEKLSLAN
jgi:hypothetical protein